MTKITYAISMIMIIRILILNKKIAILMTVMTSVMEINRLKSTLILNIFFLLKLCMKIVTFNHSNQYTSYKKYKGYFFLSKSLS